MMFTIAKSYTFSAAHQLDGLGDRHKCAYLHGHNYVVDLELAGPLDDNGMVFDYGRLKPFGDFIDSVLDHKLLNDVVPFNPTAELLAQYLYSEAKRALGALPAGVTIAAVRVHETDRTVAEHRP